MLTFIFRGHSHENEARVTKFKRLRMDFPLIFLIKSISVANDAEIPL